MWWRGGTSGLSDPGSEGWDSSVDSGFLRKSTACTKWGHTCEEPIREQRSVRPNVRLISIFCVCVCMWDTNQSESSFHHPDTSEDHQSRPENTTFKLYLHKHRNFIHLQLTDPSALRAQPESHTWCLRYIHVTGSSFNQYDMQKNQNLNTLLIPDEMMSLQSASWR